jgi:anti-sigma factor RsiW
VACEAWSAKVEAYVDGELTGSDANALSTHLRSCSLCAAEALERVQLKRSIAGAGKRYEPSPALRAKVIQSFATKPRRQIGWSILVVPALIVLLISITANWYLGRESARRQRVYSELADLHVSAVASANPVDVVSSDRHTVKPWFQGKIPFSFNLPELQNTAFSLVGGRVTYIAQTPGAHLIYQIRKHEISVFIFQDRGDETVSLPSGALHALSFNTESWTQHGLRYFVLGDVSADDIHALSQLLQGAG